MVTSFRGLCHIPVVFRRGVGLGSSLFEDKLAGLWLLLRCLLAGSHTSTEYRRSVARFSRHTLFGAYILVMAAKVGFDTTFLPNSGINLAGSKNYRGDCID